MARATQLGTSSAAANARPPPSAPAPSPSIARMTADTTSDLKEIKQTTHASRTQRPRLRGASDVEYTDPTVDQEHDDHGLENNKALDTFDTFTLAQFPAGRVLQQRASQPQEPSTARGRARSRRSVRRQTTPLHRKHASGGQNLGGARNVRLRRSTANCGSTQAPLASVASAAAATAFTKTMGSRPKSTKPTRFAAASCKAEFRLTRTAATITRSQLSSN